MPNKIAPPSPDKYIFLDRDGVINRDSSDYIKRWEDFEFLPGSLEALKKLTVAGYRIIVITNQSIIGRGWVPPAVLEDIFARMRAKIEAAGGRIHDIFFCPHAPDEGCNCRKPAIGLITRAAETYGIDIAATPMVGDSAKDIQCAKAAGCKTAILVKTGNYAAACKALAENNLAADATVHNLLQAVNRLLGSRK